MPSLEPETDHETTEAAFSDACGQIVDLIQQGDEVAKRLALSALATGRDIRTSSDREDVIARLVSLAEHRGIGAKVVSAAFTSAYNLGAFSIEE